MLTFQNLSFDYNAKSKLFHDLDLNFQQGRTLLLGPNGAGKSTLFKLAVGVNRPISGTISPNGLRLTLMPQEIHVFRGLSVREQVAYNAWLSGVDSKTAWLTSAESLEKVGLSNEATMNPKKLSGGQLRRMGIASALSTGAQILLLDEPTAGLDPNQVAGFYQTLAELGELKCIIVSSHQIDGIGNFYDHVAVLDSGQIRFHGTFEDFASYGYQNGTTNQSEALVNSFRKFTTIQ